MDQSFIFKYKHFSFLERTKFLSLYSNFHPYNVSGDFKEQKYLFKNNYLSLYSHLIVSFYLIKQQIRFLVEEIFNQKGILQQNTPQFTVLLENPTSKTHFSPMLNLQSSQIFSISSTLNSSENINFSLLDNSAREILYQTLPINTPFSFLGCNLNFTKLDETFILHKTSLKLLEVPLNNKST